MQVGVDDLGDFVVALGRQVDIRVDVDLRVDDGCLAALARSEEVRGAAGLVVQKLLEVHMEPPPGALNGTPGVGPIGGFARGAPQYATLVPCAASPWQSCLRSRSHCRL